MERDYATEFILQEIEYRKELFLEDEFNDKKDKEIMLKNTSTKERLNRIVDLVLDDEELSQCLVSTIEWHIFNANFDE